MAMLLTAALASALPAPVAALAAQLEVTFGLPAAQARAHAAAAVAAARPDIPAEVLVAIAAKESSFNHRLHGRLKTARGVSRFCGALQAMSGGSARRCAELTDIATGYAAGAAELGAWLDGRCKGNLACALRAHGCGNAGVRGACAKYPRAITARLTHLAAGTRYPPRRRQATTAGSR